MTDDQIKKHCEKAFQNGGPRVVSFNPEFAKFVGSNETAKHEAEFGFPGWQVWARRKLRGTRGYEWRRVPTTWEKREATKPPSDTEMLNWLCQEGRYISTCRDGDYCSVWHPAGDYNNTREPVEGWPQKLYATPREAIAAAMRHTNWSKSK